MSHGGAGRPSTTANFEFPDGDVMVGPFGDYARTPAPRCRSCGHDADRHSASWGCLTGACECMRLRNLILADLGRAA